MGSQKFGAYWTGDNNSVQTELKGCLIMLLQNGIAGQPFGGCDIPGFYGKLTDDLFIQFYQLGSYFPFMRAHSHIDFPNREPWLQSQRVQVAIRDAVNRRYDLIHYSYTNFYLMSKSGDSLMRTMWSEFPDDQSTYTIDS
jgi:alpha 1,3-glucosidase